MKVSITKLLNKIVKSFLFIILPLFIVIIGVMTYFSFITINKEIDTEFKSTKLISELQLANSLHGFFNISKLISTRSAAKENLKQFIKGEKSFEAANKRITKILTAAFKGSDFINGIKRVSRDGEIIASVGTDFDINGKDMFKSKKIKFIKIDQNSILVKSPIQDKEALWGYDYISFSLSGIKQLLFSINQHDNKYKTILAYSDKKRLYSINKEQNEKLFEDSSEIFFKNLDKDRFELDQNVYSISQLKNQNLFIVIESKKSILYESLDSLFQQILLFVGFTLLLLFIVFKKLIYPLENKIVKLFKKNEELNWQLNSVTESIPDILYRCDINDNWTIRYMNNAIYKITGYPKEDFICDKVRSFASIIHPEDAQYVTDVVMSGVEQNKPYEINYRLIAKDGRIIDVYESGKKVIDSNNMEILEGIIRDVTELKQKDLLILEQSKHVAIGDMIENIAHQWRQPLSIISTAASSLKLELDFETLTNDKILKASDTINDNTQYLSETINDFADFINSDRKKVQFNLENNINSFLNLIEGIAKKNNIHIIKDIDEDITINSYPNELIQCFINIFNNSKDVFKDKQDEKLLFISANIKDEKVIITFKDNGGGIPDDVLPHIFEPYFTTKHKARGKGLGLHMGYKFIVEGMNGFIHAENVTYEFKEKEYTGAEFSITLPLQ